DVATRTLEASARARRARVRRRFGEATRARELHDVLAAPARHTRAGAFRCISGPTAGVHLVVPGGGPRAVQGLLRLPRGQGGRQEPRRARLRLVSPTVAGLLDVRLVQ